MVVVVDGGDNGFAVIFEKGRAREGQSMMQKPKHLEITYAEQFKDLSIVEA